VPSTAAGEQGDGYGATTSVHAVELAAGSSAATAPAATTLPAASASTPATRRPRPPAQPTAGRRRARRGLARRLRAPVAALVVLALLASGAYLASQSVYFIATNSRGLVTIYRGVPFELLGGLKLYSSDYVSGVSAARLSVQRRQTLLDHSLRSEKDAAELVRQLELGELSER